MTIHPTLKEWQEVVTAYAIDHGFCWTKDDIDTMLLRLHSEISEAGEAIRDDNMEEFAEELADIFIRLVNTAEVMGVNLDLEVTKKHEFNLKRPKLHGRKRK